MPPAALVRAVTCFIIFRGLIVGKQNVSDLTNNSFFLRRITVRILEKRALISPIAPHMTHLPLLHAHNIMLVKRGA
jgi:hypothetical protein